jgi:L-seryl-tRNA(Ser) seleniumtransferase
MADVAALLPLLPAVDKILSAEDAAALLTRFARAAVIEAIRDELDSLRVGIREGVLGDPKALSAASVLAGAERRLAAAGAPRLRRVINATGVILHTNLGRALLAPSAAARVLEAALEPCTLEFELDRAGRGDRDDLVEAHIVALTGAEAATVVNNNAAAVLLLLNTLAQNREVIVSRGELVEIGGSFRIPDVMEKSGALLREVGTTNRTHLDDYRRALTTATAMLLKVHTSNYRVVGFTASVQLADLVELARGREGIVVAEDLGSGALVDLEPHGLGHEPLVAERLAAGVDVVSFSGDKLLGGPQCGILAGRRELIDRMRRNPLKRALRCDKMTLAALEETLRLYRFAPDPFLQIPTLRSLTRSVDEIDAMGAKAAKLIQAALGPGYAVELVASTAKAGSGSRPDLDLESRALAVRCSVLSADEVAARFRSADPPIIGRIEGDRFLLDLRAIADPAILVPKLP